MAVTISCFITMDYQVFTDPTEMDKSQCRKYEFDLESRLTINNLNSSQRTVVFFLAAQDFFDRLVGTPEKLMEFAKRGQLSKASLGALLEPRLRKLFLKVCADLEKLATERCGAKRDPCLEDGCAFTETDETCLNAVLISEGKCLEDCVDAWIGVFQYPKNRIEVWRK